MSGPGPEYKVSVKENTFKTVPYEGEEDEEDVMWEYAAQDEASLFSEICRRGTGSRDFDDEKILELFEETTHIFTLRRGEEEPVGFLLLNMLYSRIAQSKDSADIVLVCTTESVKGQKLSSLLINDAIRFAADKGKKAVHLEALTHALGEKAYAPLGFKFDKPGDVYMTYTIRTGGSRLNVQTRRSKRNGRTRKGRKLRKLTARRR